MCSYCVCPLPYLTPHPKLWIHMKVLEASPPWHWQGAVETPNCLWLHPVPPPGPAPSALAAASPPRATPVVQPLTAASLAVCHRSRHQTHPVAAAVACITTSVISYLGRRRSSLGHDVCLPACFEICSYLFFLTPSTQLFQTSFCFCYTSEVVPTFLFLGWNGFKLTGTNAEYTFRILWIIYLFCLS